MASNDSKIGLDELLKTGKIANAVDFYNYFKSKHTCSQPQALVTSISSASSSSSISSYCQGQPSSLNHIQSGGKKNKKNRSTLNDYASILQNQNSHNQTSLYLNQPSLSVIKPIKCRNNSTSSIDLSEYSQSPVNSNNSTQAKATNQSQIKISSSSNLSIPSNSYNFTSQNEPSSINKQKQHHQFSVYNLVTDKNNLNSHCSNNMSTSMKQIQSLPKAKSKDFIYNYYLIENKTINEPSNNFLKTFNGESKEKKGLTNNVLAIRQENEKSTIISHNTTNSSLRNLSSVFLNSSLNNYYKKYNLQQAGTFTLKSTDLEFERQQKEDAINRIIRNEKIKQIRNKMIEYELLKDYQTLASPNSPRVETDSYNCSGLFSDDLEINNINEKSDKKAIKITNQNSVSSLSQSSSQSSMDIPFYRKIPKAMFEEYTFDSSVEGFQNNQSEEADYESGIEDDNIVTNQQIYNNQHRIKSNMNRAYNQNLGTAKNQNLGFVKPGHEHYQVGDFNLYSSQSKFNLKISIISAEVKNIVKVLKQVTN
jgi:hypothetical protein